MCADDEYRATRNLNIPLAPRPDRTAPYPEKCRTDELSFAASGLILARTTPQPPEGPRRKVSPPDCVSESLGPSLTATYHKSRRDPKGTAPLTPESCRPDRQTKQIKAVASAYVVSPECAPEGPATIPLNPVCLLCLTLVSLGIPGRLKTNRQGPKHGGLIFRTIVCGMVWIVARGCLI